MDSIQDTENLGDDNYDEPMVNFEEIDKIEGAEEKIRVGRQSEEVANKRKSAMLGSHSSVLASLFDMKAEMR